MASPGSRLPTPTLTSHRTRPGKVRGNRRVALPLTGMLWPFQQRVLYHQLPGPPRQGYSRTLRDCGRTHGESGQEGWQGTSPFFPGLVQGMETQGEQLGKEAYSRDTTGNAMTGTGPGLQVPFLWSVLVALVASIFLSHLPKS